MAASLGRVFTAVKWLARYLFDSREGPAYHVGMSRSGFRRRPPNRVHIPAGNGAILSFWRATDAVIASNAARYEDESEWKRAAESWEFALSGSVANQATREFCLDRVKYCRNRFVAGGLIP